MVAFLLAGDEQILSIFYGKVNLAITSSLNKDLILENLIETEMKIDKQEFQNFYELFFQI